MKTYEFNFVAIDEIAPYEKNSRTHNTSQIKQIMESIKAFGFTNPLLIDEDFNLIAGHGRLEAIKQLNTVDFKDNPVKEVPCIVVSGLNEVERKALVIADNKIALNAGWDMDILGQELLEIEEANFDMDLIGFSESELANILGDFEEAQTNYKSPGIGGLEEVLNNYSLAKDLNEASDECAVTFTFPKHMKDYVQKNRDIITEQIKKKYEKETKNA